jgi:UDP-glucose 6-dehydrogenase
MDKKPIIGIIGFGITGEAIHHGFAQTTDFRIYDKNPKISENTLEEVVKDSDFIFLCLPTPMKKKTGEADISIIENVLHDANDITFHRKDKIFI